MMPIKTANVSLFYVVFYDITQNHVLQVLPKWRISVLIYAPPHHFFMRKGHMDGLKKKRLCNMQNR